MRKLWGILLSCVMLIGISAGSVLASESVDQNQQLDIQKEQVYTIKPPADTIKDLSSIMKEISPQIDEYMRKNSTYIRSSSLYIDQNKTTSSADIGGCGIKNIAGSPVFAYNYSTNGRWADASVNCGFMPGTRTSGEAWALVGNRMGVYSNNSKTQEDCTIDFSGILRGSIAYFNNIFAGGQIATWAEVVDVTNSNNYVLVAQWGDDNITGTGSFYRTFDPAGTCTLKKGHIYDFRMVLFTKAFDTPGTDNSSVDCYNNARGSDGLDYNSINFTW